MIFAKKNISKRLGIACAAVVGLGVTHYSHSADDPKIGNLPENYGRVDTKLFLGEGQNQPLIVGFGGAEGGNLFAKAFAKPAVDGFLAQGYSFLALGYFGEPGIPKEIDRIALEGVHDAILAAARNPKVNRACIALIGASKGAELALVLASYYPDIKAVVGMVPGHAVFAAHTSTMSTSSFSLDGEPLPFVPVPKSAVPYLLKHQLRPAWEEMLKDQAAVEKAAIAVERVNGPILLISATRDEYWPSTEMSELIGQRLKKNNFGYRFEHVAIEGQHTDAEKHPDLTDAFLKANFLAENAAGCPRARN